jgi:hypothetical protein
MVLLAVASVLVLVGCDGDGNGGQQVLAPGQVVVQRAGGVANVTGRVAFRNAAGAAMNQPPGGVLVVAGPGSRAVGTNAQGEFEFPNLPDGGSIPIYAGVPGLLPGMVEIGPGDNGAPAQSLVCREDTTRADDPAIGPQNFGVDPNAVARLQSQAPVDTLVKAYYMPGGQPNGPLPNSPVDVLNTEYGPSVNGTRNFTVALYDDAHPNIPTGVLRAFLFDQDLGVGEFVDLSCDLSLDVYNRSGRNVQGVVTGPAGAAQGAEVLVYDSADSNANREEDFTNAQGAFNLDLPEAPTGGVVIFVVWQDDDGGWHTCRFDR